MTTPQQSQLEALETRATQLREAIHEVRHAKGIAVSPSATGIMVAPTAKHLPAINNTVSHFVFNTVRDHLLQSLVRELENVDRQRNQV